MWSDCVAIAGNLVAVLVDSAWHTCWVLRAKEKRKRKKGMTLNKDASGEEPVKLVKKPTKWMTAF